MEYIGDCLNKKGGISSSSLDELIKMMKNSENKLVSKFLALAIMSESEVDVQINICKSVIWNILFEWLEDGLKNDTTCFIVEILQLYLKLPVTIENLTSNDCSKLIKKLSKNGNEEVTSKAKSIVAKWEKIVNKPATSNRVIPCKKIKLDTKDVLTKDLDENVNKKEMEIDSANVQQISNRSILNTETEKPDESSLKMGVISNFEKRKVCEIQESGIFINSITQKPNPSRKRKRRQALSQILNKSAPDIKAPEHQIANNNTVEVIISMESQVQKPKKRVSWASGDSLQSIKYFELDENERINVNRVSMEEMKRNEHLMERQNVHKNVFENESQLDKWYRPLKLFGVSLKNCDPLTEEKRIQELRERKFLKVFYFSRSDIPNSPGEPEKETFCDSEMKIIPMEISGNSKLISEESILKQVVTGKGEDKAKSVKPGTENFSLNITESSLTSTSSNYEIPQTKAKLIKIIKTSYPDIDPEKLSSEEVYKLLEPLREKLIKEGILNSDSEKTVENQPKLTTGTDNTAKKDLTKSKMIFRKNSLVQPFFRPIILCPPQSHVFSNNFFRHPATQIRPVCKFFSNGGYCRSGNNCTFSHILPNSSLNQNRR